MVAAIYAVDGTIGPRINDTSTTAKFKLGQRVTAVNGQEYVYVQASAAINQYDCVAVNNVFSASGMTKALADLGLQPANAPYAIAALSYGWVCIHGEGLIQTVLGSCDKGVVLCTSAVTGVLDDGTGSQTKIWGAVCIASAGTTGTTSVSFNLIHPHSQLAGVTT